MQAMPKGTVSQLSRRRFVVCGTLPESTYYVNNAFQGYTTIEFKVNTH